MGRERERSSTVDKAEVLELVGQNYLKTKNGGSLKEIELCS